jgi:hypothetical protein
MERPRVVGFGTQVWRLLQTLTALGFLYELIAITANHLNEAFSDGGGQILPLWLNTDPFGTCTAFGIDPAVCGGLATCFTVTVVTLVLLGLLCEEEWVQETVDVKKCWEEISWNPWGWVKALVCTFVEVTRWVLKLVCEIKWALVITVAIVCVVAVVVALA